MISRIIWTITELIISMVCTFNMQELFRNYENVLKYGTDKEKQLFPFFVVMLVCLALLCIILAINNMIKVYKSDKEALDKKLEKQSLEVYRDLKKEVRKRQLKAQNNNNTDDIS